MVRYLHDGQEIPVTKYKTIGGYLITNQCYLDMKLRKNNLEKSELYLKVKTTKIEVENELSPEGTKADHFPKLTPSIYCCEATV
uniref:Uncharacterized protein n=1 Tax=Caenorhabditis japonica TaxID=281687 RepID=A0A8R1I6J7_CAEJA